MAVDVVGLVVLFWDQQWRFPASAEVVFVLFAFCDLGFLLRPRVNGVSPLKTSVFFVFFYFFVFCNFSPFFWGFLGFFPLSDL